MWGLGKGTMNWLWHQRMGSILLGQLREFHLRRDGERIALVGPTRLHGIGIKMPRTPMGTHPKGYQRMNMSRGLG